MKLSPIVTAYQCERCAFVLMAVSEGAAPNRAPDVCPACPAAGFAIPGAMYRYGLGIKPPDEPVGRVWVLNVAFVLQEPPAGLILPAKAAPVAVLMRTFSSPSRAAVWLTEALARERVAIVEASTVPMLIDDPAGAGELIRALTKTRAH